MIALVLALSGCTGTGSAVAGQPNFDIAYLYYPLLAALFVLALAFMLSKIFNMQHWTAMIGDEVLQVLATGVVAILLIGVQLNVDGYLSNAFLATGAPLPPSCTGNKIGCTNEIAYNKLTDLHLESVFTGLQDSSTWLGQQASRGIYCNLLNVGFTLSNCGQLNAFRGSLTMSSFAVMTAIVDVYAQQFLLTLARNYAFSLIIPLGLFFRCFKMSRQAGGALIAIGFGFYTAYPLTIIAMSNLLTGFGPSNPPIMPEPQYTGVPSVGGSGNGECHGPGGCSSHNNDGASCRAAPGCTWFGECDPYETNTDVSRAQYDDFAGRLTAPSVAQGLTYLVLVKGIFMSILNLIVTLGFIRMFAHLLGADIDVSSLARLS